MVGGSTVLQHSADPGQHCVPAAELVDGTVTFGHETYLAEGEEVRIESVELVAAAGVRLSGVLVLPLRSSEQVVGFGSTYAYPPVDHPSYPDRVEEAEGFLIEAGQEVQLAVGVEVDPDVAEAGYDGLVVRFVDGEGEAGTTRDAIGAVIRAAC